MDSSTKFTKNTKKDIILWNLIHEICFSVYMQGGHHPQKKIMHAIMHANVYTDVE